MARALIVEIFADSRQFAREMDKAAGKTRRFGAAAGVAGVALGGALVVGLEKSAKAAMEGQADQARLDAALRTTHQSIKAMTPSIEKAEQSSRRWGFADNETRLALAKLEVATKNTHTATADLAVAENISRLTKVDLQTATKMLTGSMAGNTRAAKALGIILMPVTTHMDALKEKYKALGKEIPPAERAQARLLDKMATGKAAIQQVTDKVRGQAAAYAETAQGGMAKFHSEIQRLEEVFGNMLLPAIEAVTKKLAVMADFLSRHTTLAKILGAGLGVLATALIAVSVATQLANLAFLASPWGLVALAIAALVIGIIELVKHWDAVRGAMGDLWNWISSTFIGIWDDVKNAMKTVTDWITGTAISVFNSLKGAIKAVKDWVSDNWAEIATLISGPFALLVAPATNAFGVRDKLIAAFEWVKTETKRILGDVVTFFTNLGSNIWDGFKGGWETAKTNIGNSLDWVKTHALSVVDNTAGFFKDLPGKIGDAIGGAMGDLKDKLKSLFSWKTIVGWIKDALGFGSPSPHFMAIGHDIVDSMVKGVGDSAGLLKDAVTNLAKKFIPSLSAPVGTAEPGGGGQISGTGHLVGRVINALQYARQMGWHGSVISGYRTYAEQAALWQRYVNSGFNLQYIAARPGTSSHERGEAVDVSDASRFDTIMAGAPISSQLYNNVPYDFNHFSVSGRALGGHVAAGMTYKVGERGPEFLTMGANGFITPGNRGGGGDIIVHNVIELDGKVAYESWKKQAGRDVTRNGSIGV